MQTGGESASKLGLPRLVRVFAGGVDGRINVGRHRAIKAPIDDLTGRLLIARALLVRIPVRVVERNRPISVQVIIGGVIIPAIAIKVMTVAKRAGSIRH